jgi:hypothetical protein
MSADGTVVADGIGARSAEQDYGDLNKALKMACKSAHIDATLRMAGLSEIFTQDLEDMPPENVGGESQPEQRRTTEPQRGKPVTQAPRSTGGRGFATEKQVYLIERRLDDAGVEARTLCERFDVESLVKIPFAKVNDVLAWIAEEHA